MAPIISPLRPLCNPQFFAPVFTRLLVTILGKMGLYSIKLLIIAKKKWGPGQKYAKRKQRNISKEIRKNRAVSPEEIPIY